MSDLKREVRVALVKLLRRAEGRRDMNIRTAAAMVQKNEPLFACEAYARVEAYKCSVADINEAIEEWL